MRTIHSCLSVLLLGPVCAQTRQFDSDLHRAPATLFASSYIQTLACGDVDGDGDADCVVGVLGLLGMLDVSLFRSQAGTWQRSPLFSLPPSPAMQARSTSLADLDGDLDLDVVIVSATFQGTSTPAAVRFDYFRNDGPGVFTAVRTTQVPGATSATLALGDVDGDGDRDLVIATTDAAGAPLPLLLSRNDGAFSFQVVANALPPMAVVAPQLADLDGDGDLDVVAADDTDQLRAFVNQNGTFALGAALPGVAVHIAPADLDGDGDVDLLLQRRDGATDLLRNQPGGFAAQAIAAGGQGAGSRPVVADVDGDLDADVAVQHGGEVRLWRNDGSAGFAGEVLPGVSGLIAGGDVDGDGRADIVFGSNQLGGVAAAYGGSGRLLIDPVLARARYAALGNIGRSHDTGDIDGDGRIDVLQADFDLLIVRASTGAGEWASVGVPVPVYRPDACIVDVDGDGDGDLVAVNGDAAGGLQVVLHGGGFAFSPLPLQPLPAAWIAGRADLDGDADTDLLVATGSALVLLRNVGGGAFAAPGTVVGSPIGSSAPGLTDFDGDGDVDLLVTVGAGYCAQLLLNDGAGNFTVADPCALSTGNFYAFGMKFADLDGDGDLDAFAYGYGSGRVLLNQGGTFATTSTINAVETSPLLQPWFADWDDDGDVDLLQLGGPAQLWLNDGNGAFVDVSSQRLRSGARFAASGAADLDGDGDTDVVSGLSGFGAPQTPLNHLRSLSSLSRPAPGGTLHFRLAHEPGYLGSPTAALPLLSLLPRASALAVPGFAGRLQIDVGTAVILPLVVLPAPSGIGDVQVAVPLQPSLVGFELWAQGLLLGTPPAFTPAVHERVLGS